MKKQVLIGIFILVLLLITAGCGGGSKWDKYLGMWTNEAFATAQMEIKKNGDSFILTTYENNFTGPGITTKNYIVKPVGEVLSLAIPGVGIELPIIYDEKIDKLSFDGKKYRRQTKEDAKKMEELKNSK